MSGPIKVGDLVMVVKLPACKCPRTHLGEIFTVIEVDGPIGWHCGACKSKTGYGMTARLTTQFWAGFYRLKRIPPLEELERDKLVERLTA